ncbi:GspE/PulE family protein [Acanthopleuribacter pedis]|uniref:Flp pilus assembly complex ATPase component TadA n=1 Tax=Acanthopleuribacter pedis TaxID=442870 RepID=A0A8J7Q6Y6_9BACT|nr:ATPase, T2SS/T4P/T4SS family [Acanthopleuribacter pedis]MBO1317914.1 Flp pilus assembly complex ATPase component TadA [Acanthopleuribacter pedis]
MSEETPPAEPVEEQPRERPIGEILVEEGIVSREQLDRALRIQQKLKSKRRIGRILIELDFVKESDLDEIMIKYARKIRLGDLLVEREFITPTDLEEALLAQKKYPGKRIGEVLVLERKLTEKTLCDAISLYRKIERVIPDFRKVDLDLVDKISMNFLEQNFILPYRVIEGELLIVVTEDYRDTINPVLKGIYDLPFRFGLATPTELETIFRYLQNRPKQTNARELETKHADSSVAGLVDDIIKEGIEKGASDIHIEPMDTVTRVRYRVDGHLVEHQHFALERNASVITRIKVLAECDISERRKHQDGKFQVNFHGHPIDCRVSIFVTVHGESVVVRILNPFSGLVDLDSLGFGRRNLERYVDEVIASSAGIVLITGPTGSGKTTTLYSTLQYQLVGGNKIVTVEDPVEYIIPEIVQCSVDKRAGRTFSSSLKAIMRQDPDVIVLGEIRDLESANIAIHASMTGHKVYATFHTEDTTGGLVRLVQMGVERYLVSSTVLAVVSQRLVRRICNQCKQNYIPKARLLRRVGLPPSLLTTREFVTGSGCAHCLNTGYAGRLGIHELLILEEHVRDAVLRDASTFKIREIALAEAALIPMAEDGIAKVWSNQTTLEEVLKFIPVSTKVRPINQLLEMVG